LRNLSRPPNKGRPRLACVSTNRGTSSILCNIFFTLTSTLSSAQPFPFPRQNNSREGSDPHPGDPRLRLSHSMRLKRQRQLVIGRNTPLTNAFGESRNSPPSTYNDTPMTPMQRHEQLLDEERKLFACWIARHNGKAPPRRRNNRSSYTDLPPPLENGDTSYRALFRRQYSHLFTEPGEEPPRHSKSSILFAIFSFSLTLNPLIDWSPEVLEYFPTRLCEYLAEGREQCAASTTSGTSTIPPALLNNGEPSSRR
jgi:hypothetical protein